jgi:large subunit ribosomal protein L25
LVVTAGDIPENISVDLAELEVGDVITISSVNLPKGAKPTIERDFVIANIAAPSGLRSADNEADDEAEEVEVAAEE